MKWIGRRQSDNFENRGKRGRGFALGGIGTIIVVVIALLIGENPMQLLNQVGGGGVNIEQNVSSSGDQSEAEAFTLVVLADTEDVWHKIFKEMNKSYEEPTLVTFQDAVQSACGSANSAVGPFYCPGDRKVYIDLSFYNE